MIECDNNVTRLLPTIHTIRPTILEIPTTILPRSRKPIPANTITSNTNPNG